MDEESFKNAEAELQCLLQEICNFKGEELYPSKSAEILDKIGLLYQTKSRDKISLIQSAALYNAAIVRQPNNQEFRNHLQSLCNHVLICADAQQKVDLVAFAERIKEDQLSKMRSRVNENLNKVEKIPNGSKDPAKIQLYVNQVQFLQNGLSEDYKRIMADISNKCIKIMGQHPCGYALLGMGSLARNEITPYSDFEHIITLENYNVTAEELDQCKEYFRWYSTIFHIIVINLQETDLYSVCVPCLNDHTKESGNWFYDRFTHPGISFDGMMPHACHFPLGKTQETPELPWRTELIQTINDMVKYLKVKSIKEGYKLGNLLTKTCFVAGDESVYVQFSKKVQDILAQNQTEQSTSFRQQLDEDFAKYGAKEALLEFDVDNQINIKGVIYRCITLFVSALGRLSGSDENSGFEVIEKLKNTGVVSDFAALRLFHAVAVACHLRMSTCISSGRREDVVLKENDYLGNEKLQHLFQVVERDSLVKCLATSLILQEVMSNYLTNHNISVGEGLNLAFQDLQICYELYFLNRFCCEEEAVRRGREFLENLRPKNDFVLNLGEEEPMEHLPFGNEYVRNLVLSRVCDGLIRKGRYTECLKVCKKFKELNLPVSAKTQLNVYSFQLYCNLYLNNCQLVKDKTDTLLKQNLPIKQSEFFLILSINSSSNFMLKNYNDALISLKKAYRSKNLSLQKSWNMAEFHKLPLQLEIISVSLIELGRTQQGLHWALEALNYLEKLGAHTDLQAMFVRIVKLQQRCVEYFQMDRPAPILFNTYFGIHEAVVYNTLEKEDPTIANRFFLEKIDEMEAKLASHSD